MIFKICEPTILDCTLRDGSYAIDYQFGAEDTAIIGVGLERAGFRLIEIGHGLGLGASSIKYGLAAASDEEYLAIAQKTIRKAKFGMFCIPGIATLKSLKKAARFDMGFVRVGTNVTETHKAEPLIRKAKELGMLVSSNLMKSYAVSTTEFSKKVKLVSSFGADIICVVDSAGGMLPEEIEEYVRIIKNETDAIAGFHGHDNLRLAVANSIQAIKAGAMIIDSSLRGIGRSAGNAQTEILLALVGKMGYRLGIDFYKTLDLAEKIIQPISWGGKGVDSLSIIFGTEQFHSGFLKIIQLVAQKHSIDERELIAAVSKIDRVNVTEALAEKVAKTIKPIKRSPRHIQLDFGLSKLIKKHDPNSISQIAVDMAKEMVMLSKKTGRKTVFTIAKTQNKDKKLSTFPFIRYNEAYVIGNAEVVTKNDAIKIMRSVDGLMDYILVDHPLYIGLSELMGSMKSVALAYNDSEAQILSVYKMIKLLAHKNRIIVFLLGNDYLSRKLCLQLLSEGHWVINDFEFARREFYFGLKGKLLPENPVSIKRADFIIGLTPFKKTITDKMIKMLSRKALVIDAAPGSLSEKAIAYANKTKIVMHRIDMRAGLFGEVESVIKTHYLANRIMGRSKIDDIRVVSGGIIGRRGDIVLDSIADPIRIIGVADGQGGLFLEDKIKGYLPKINKIREYIAKKRFL